MQHKQVHTEAKRLLHVSKGMLVTLQVYPELDERLQQEFPAYLEERGIDADMGNYLLALVNDKEEREYRSWLGNVHKFLSK